MGRSRRRVIARREYHCGLSVEDVASALHITPRSYAAFEAGESRLRSFRYPLLAKILSDPDDGSPWDSEEMRLAVEGNGDGLMPDVSTGWWSNYEVLEQSAVSVRTWEPMVVPGLLQTRDYAAALLGGDNEAVERRLDRQVMVTRSVDPVDLVAVVDQSVLRRPVGGEAVLADQLCHLITMAERGNVAVHVLPRDAPTRAIAIGGKGAFVILGTPWPGGLVHLEHVGGARSLDSQPELEAHIAAFDRLRDLSLSPDPSIDCIRSAAKGE